MITTGVDHDRLDVDAAAELLRVDPTDVLAALDAGTLPVDASGLIDRRALWALLDPGD